MSEYKSEVHTLIDQQCSRCLTVRLDRSAKPIRIDKSVGGGRAVHLESLGKSEALRLSDMLREAAELAPDEPTNCEFPGMVISCETWR